MEAKTDVPRKGKEKSKEQNHFVNISQKNSQQMTNRIQNLLDSKKESLLSIYLTAGYPNLNDTLDLIIDLEKSGVDLIELGFPFSDPLADGPVIQESSRVAIENGMSLAILFQQLKELRKRTQIPILLMGYLNPVLQFGEQQFIEKCSEVGVDGIVIPDMPLDYYRETIQEQCEKHSISTVFLITPETSAERIHEIDKVSSSFIYMVSSTSVTGKTTDLSPQEKYFKRVDSMKLKHATLVGFGIHDKKTFQQAVQYSKGAIIGSSFINHIRENGTQSSSIQQFIKNIRS
jgi:tryptophan synthase alpha chain